MARGIFAMQERKRIINAVLEAIKSATIKGSEVDKNKLIAELALKYGVTLKKAKEYLTILTNAELISESNGKIIATGFRTETTNET